MSGNRLEKKVIEEIVRLFETGLSNKEITEKLGVKQGTVSYHTNNTTKTKGLEYQKKNRTIFVQKVHNFYDTPYMPAIIPKTTRPERTFKYKVRGFFRDKKYLTKGLDMKSRLKEVEEKLWPYDGKNAEGLEYPYATDAITGLKINVMAPKATPGACNFDHELPKSRGGPNEVGNFQALHEVINAMKGKLTNDELFSWVDKIIDGPLYKEYKNEE